MKAILILLLLSLHVVWSQLSPTASILSTTDTTLSLSWSVPSGITVDSYEVMWQRDTTGECSNEDEGSATITDGSTSYTITGLEEYSNYTITVTAADISGSIISDPVTGTTNEAAPSAPPTSVSVTDVTPHSLTVHWGPVDCIHRNGDIIGYLVQYELDAFRVIYEDISGRMIQLSDLTASTSYVIEIGAFNNAGSRVFYQRTLLTSVETPVLCAEQTTSNTIFVIWTSAGSVVDSYELMWQRATTPNDDEGSATVTDGSTSYNITGLEAGSTYIINVTAHNAIGSAVSNTVIETLMETAQNGTESSNKGLSAGAIAGISVASIVVAIVLILICICCLWCICRE